MSVTRVIQIEPHNLFNLKNRFHLEVHLYQLTLEVTYYYYYYSLLYLSGQQFDSTKFKTKRSTSFWTLVAKSKKLHTASFIT